MKKNLPILTGLRFAVAFFVLLLHVDLRKPLEFLPRNIISQGAVGVNVFFILSCLILFYEYSKKLNFVEFILKRIQKEIPFTFFGLILSGIIYFMFNLNIYYPLEVLIMNVMMIQSYLRSFSMVWYGGGSWSISTEFFFYFCFPFILTLILKLSKKAVLISIACIYLLRTIPGVFHNLAILPFNFSYTFPPFRMAEFMSGMLSTALVFKYGIKSNTVLSILIIFLCAVFFHFIRQGLKGYTIQNIIALPIMLVLLVSVTTQQKHVLRFPGNSFFEYLGKISYSFYIIQLPIMLVLDSSEQWAEINSFVLLLFVFLVNMLGAVLTYHLVEYRFNSYFNKSIKSYYNRNATVND